MSVQDRVIEVVKQVYLFDSTEDIVITPDSRLMDDFDADSLDIIELTMALEDEFAIEIFDEEMDQVTVVRECVELINTKLAEKEANETNQGR